MLIALSDVRKSLNFQKCSNVAVPRELVDVLEELMYRESERLFRNIFNFENSLPLQLDIQEEASLSQAQNRPV